MLSEEFTQSEIQLCVSYVVSVYIVIVDDVRVGPEAQVGSARHVVWMCVVWVCTYGDSAMKLEEMVRGREIKDERVGYAHAQTPNSASYTKCSNTLIASLFSCNTKFTVAFCEISVNIL